ncbi:MAG: long-chain fatty acid--CoA ligase [Myxococcaceae bacterium]
MAVNVVSVPAAASSSEKNLLEILDRRVREATVPAATAKLNGKWTDVSWAELRQKVEALSNALVAWGVKPGERVAIFASTSLQWLVTDLALSGARAVCVPIYASNTPGEVRYILQNSGAVMCFVDDDAPDAKQPGRLTRLKQKIAECPEVKTVVLFEGTAEGVTPLADLLKKGEGAGGYDERVKQVGPDDLCHFIYTSGTTGDPKGVMLSHGNWAYEAHATRQVGMMEPNDAVMLFLPLAHSFAQVIKASWLGMGFRLVIAESIDKLIPNLAETNPTILPSVPRVFEKVFNGVYSTAVSAPGLKGSLARWAFRLFDEWADARGAGRAYDSLGWSLAKRLVFSKVAATVSQRLGGKMRLFISGGAPLSRKIGLFFELLGYEILEGFGLTETSAATVVNPPGKSRIGTVGKAVPGTEVKINPDGEIMLKGPGVMKGYWKQEAATREVLEPDGWFHSGDIGEFDADGYLKITDRKKDIIVTAGGKNVAPQNLENLLKTYPLISSAMVYGDKRAFLTVLICVAEDYAKKLLSDKGITAASYEDLAKRPEIAAAVQKVLDDVNGQQPPYNTLKKFTVMDHDFTQESGELTPTLKVKRKFCSQKYAAQLDAMYAGKAME